MCARVLDLRDGTIPVVSCVSNIACTPAELFAYLVSRLPATCHEWNDLMYHASSHPTADDACRVGTILSDGWPVRDREDCFVQIVDRREEDGREVWYELSTGLGTEHVGRNASGAARRSHVRSNMHFASKRMAGTPQGGCEYTTVWHYDPAGWTSRLMPRALLAKIVLKNLVHEHAKLRHIFASRGPAAPHKADTTRRDLGAFFAALALLIAAGAIGGAGLLR